MIRISTQLFSVFHQAGRSTALRITALLQRFCSDTQFFLHKQPLYLLFAKEVYAFDHILPRSTQCHMHDCLSENHPYSSHCVLRTHCSGECTPFDSTLVRRLHHLFALHSFEVLSWDGWIQTPKSRRVSGNLWKFGMRVVASAFAPTWEKFWGRSG